MFDWQYRKTDELFQNSSIKNQEDEELLSVTQDSGVLPRSLLERRVVMPDGNTKNYKLVEQGDFIISLRSFQGGLEYSNYRGLVSPAYTVIKPKAPIEVSFYRQYFKSHRFINQLNSSVIGIRDGKQISYQVFKDIEVPYPPLSEQRKIADILTSVDNAISKTEAIIKQTEKVKKGLMQQLLTKGIGHTRFKQTEIGQIPDEWKIESDFIKIKSGYGFNLSEYTEEGIPLIRINNVKYGELDFDDIKFLPETYLESYHQFVLSENDLILALNRPITQNRLKIAKVSKQDLPAILYQRIGKLLLDKSQYNQDYIYYYLQSEKFLEQLSATFVGSDQPFIKNSEFAKLIFVIPPIEEQAKIADIFNSVFNKIRTEYRKLNQLYVLKKGLLQVLLTGKVRVKVDNQEAVIT